MRKGVYLLAKMSVHQAVRAAQVAEHLGYDYCMVPDEACQRDPWVALSAIASATTRIDLGVCVTNPYTRHPVVSATAACTLAEYLGRPVTLGIGAGGSEIEDFMGFSRSSPAKAIGEMITIIRGLARGQTLNFQGRLFRSSGARLEFATPLRIMVAGRGPRVLSTAAALADEVLLLGIAHHDIPETISLIADAARRSANQPQLTYDVFLATSDAEMFGIRPHFVYMFLDMPQPAKERLGLDEAFEAALRRTFYNEGILAAAEMIHPDLLADYVIDGRHPDAPTLLRDILRQGFSALQVTVTRAEDIEAHLERALDLAAQAAT